MKYVIIIIIIIIIIIMHTFLYCHKVVTSEAVYSPPVTGTKSYCLVTEAHWHIGVSSLPKATTQ